MERLETSIYLDESLDDGCVRVSFDAKTKERMIFVSADLFEEVEAGNIPDVLADEIKKGRNGKSPI